MALPWAIPCCLNPVFPLVLSWHSRQLVDVAWFVWTSPVDGVYPSTGVLLSDMAGSTPLVSHHADRDRRRPFLTAGDPAPRRDDRVVTRHTNSPRDSRLASRGPASCSREAPRRQAVSRTQPDAGQDSRARREADQAEATGRDRRGEHPWRDPRCRAGRGADPLAFKARRGPDRPHCHGDVPSQAAERTAGRRLQTPLGDHVTGCCHGMSVPLRIVSRKPDSQSVQFAFNLIRYGRDGVSTRPGRGVTTCFGLSSPL